MDQDQQSAARLLQAALTAAARGWRVFPVLPGSKIPAVKDWETRATVDLRRIQQYWTPTETNQAQWNIGIACGPSGLVVVDLDIAKPDNTIPDEYTETAVRNGARVLADLQVQHGQIGLPATYTVETRSGGRHLYFRQPERAVGSSVGRLGWLIDIRGVGGSVLAAGSQIDDIEYWAIDPDAEIAELPDWIGQEVADSTEGRRMTDRTIRIPGDESRRLRYIESAVRNEINRVLTSEPRKHNNALFKAALSLGRLAKAGQLDPAAIRGALIAAREAVGHPEPGEARATIESGFRHAGLGDEHEPRSDDAARGVAL